MTRLTFLASGFLVVLGSTLLLLGGSYASAHHADHTHDAPEAILTGLENVDLPNRVVRNNIVLEYLVTSDTDALDSATDAAVTNWNDGLRNYSPNLLTKYPFHKNPGYDDPNANVRVIGYLDVFPDYAFDHRCSVGAHACVEDELNPDDDHSVNMNATPLYVIVNLSAVTTDAHKRGDIAHEFGHVLFFNEHYTCLNCSCTSGYSATYYSVLDKWECDSLEGPSTHDRQDFFDAYQPKDVPGPSSMTIGTGTVQLNWSNSALHNIFRFYYNRQTDTNGAFVDDGYTSDKFTVSKVYSVADGNRYCAKSNGVSDAGFQGGNIFSPRTFFGCWSQTTGAAGRLLATSHRLFGSELRVRNLSGGTRDIAILSSAFTGIGCNTATIPNNGPTLVPLASASVSIRIF